MPFLWMFVVLVPLKKKKLLSRFSRKKRKSKSAVSINKSTRVIKVRPY